MSNHLKTGNHYIQFSNNLEASAFLKKYFFVIHSAFSPNFRHHNNVLIVVKELKIITTKKKLIVMLLVCWASSSAKLCSSNMSASQFKGFFDNRFTKKIGTTSYLSNEKKQDLLFFRLTNTMLFMV